MIQELRIKNFLSFKDEVVFSFEATKDNTLEDYYVKEVAPGVRLLKMAMVYGANASGKSNLVNAFDFIRTFIFNKVEDKDEDIDFHPFEFDTTRDEVGFFKLIIYINGIKHIYSIEVDKNYVYNETLSFYPGTQPAIIFEREFNSDSNTSIVNFGPKIKISKTATEEIVLKTVKNSSVFAAYSQVNISIPEIEEVYNWAKNKFLPSINPYTDLTSFSDEQIKMNSDIKEAALKFIKEADFNISDIIFEEKTEKISDEVLMLVDDAPIPQSEKDRIKKDKSIIFNNTYFEHHIINNGIDEYYKLHENRQSKGTMRYYGLSAPFFTTLNNNAFLCIDEIGSALHPLLVMHFIREFLEKSDSAQLLFTTHNISLLNEKDLLRKDAVWFTEKGGEGATQLHSVADYPEFRKELSYYNFYKLGKFGAIPNLD